MRENINFKLSLYLTILISFSIFFLFVKHDVANDSTISEWLINYEGGFTKRGLIGQIVIFFSILLDHGLRQTIFIFQILSCLIYFILIYNLLKNTYYDRTALLAIFTPIFILYPIAEMEVLARKEILIFVLYLSYLLIPRNHFAKNIYFVFFFFTSVLIWEPVIFFIFFIFAVEIIENKINNIFDKKFLSLILRFSPGLALAFYIALNPISEENHNLMSMFLMNQFGEACYMSCALLKSKSSIIQQFQGNFGKYSLEIFIRYFLIILIGFGPIFILLKKSVLIDNKLLFFKKFNNLFLPTITFLTPVIVLFAMGYDWGRWVNISYVFTFIFYFYLLKKKLILIKDNPKFNFINNLSKKFFIFVVIIFCFSWNPKTVITGDIASFPGYRIPYKTVSYFIRGHF